MSQHARPRIEPAFGWLKTIAWLRKVKLQGLPKVDCLFVFASATFKPDSLAQAAAENPDEADVSPLHRFCPLPGGTNVGCRRLRA